MNAASPKTMRAVVLTGLGGLDRLVYREDVPVPAPGPGEVLIRVGACGMNNTDVNTRSGWYAKAVTSGTTREGAAEGFEEVTGESSTWGSSSLAFPHVQGADVTGRVAAVGPDVPETRIGERVLVDPWLRDSEAPEDREKAGYLGSERWGGFAEFTAVPAVNAFPIESQLSDAELATFPCSSSTAEYMLTRSALGDGETILITGASGGVGSALVQLAKRRGARTVALAGESKMAALGQLGADHVLPRDVPDLAAALDAALGRAKVEVVADIVGGERFPELLGCIERGGRYVTSGAIAGPIVELDLRTLYLEDLTLYGATVMPPGIFKTLVGYIERGEIRPLLARTFPLAELRAAQEQFLEKAHVGNFVVVP
jgi:NADPH:quinone reductase-like Zn-dependent oxidoreductase